MGAASSSPLLVRAQSRQTFDVLGSGSASGRSWVERGGVFPRSVELSTRRGGSLHHHAEREQFYLFSGLLVVSCAGKEYVLEPGDSLEVEPHATHPFRNPSHDQTAIALTLGSPAGHDRFFEAADAFLRAGGFSHEGGHLHVCLK